LSRGGFFDFFHNGVSRMPGLMQDEITRALTLCGVPELRKAGKEILLPA
jgi:hypothetical protein